MESTPPPADIVHVGKHINYVGMHDKRFLRYSRLAEAITDQINLSPKLQEAFLENGHAMYSDDSSDLQVADYHHLTSIIIEEIIETGKKLAEPSNTTNTP